MAEPLLLVEDDDLLREVLEGFLEEQGFEVHPAGDGAQALALIRSGGLRPVVIVLDLRMPAMSGWELLRILDRDEDLADVPRVVITGDRRHGLDDTRPERTTVLIKPFSSSDLVSAVWRWCERHDSAAVGP